MSGGTRPELATVRSFSASNADFGLGLGRAVPLFGADSQVSGYNAPAANAHSSLAFCCGAGHCPGP